MATSAVLSEKRLLRRAEADFICYVGKKRVSKSPMYLANERSRMALDVTCCHRLAAA